MTDLTVFENIFKGPFPDTLFQKPEFFKLHANSNVGYFELCRRDVVIASIHFTPTGANNTWRSPAKGTFAGLHFAPGSKYSDLVYFLEYVEATLEARGARQLEVILPPEAHSGTVFAQQFYLFRSLGFDIAQCDLNQSLDVDDRGLSERMTYGNLKRLRKCEREGFVASSLPLAELPSVYETLEINRGSKGNALSMNLAQLKLMADTFPDKILLFGCGLKNELAASAVCLGVSPDVLYVFYWGDRPEYRSHSPVVMLANAIYQYAQIHAFKILDVGTSTIDRAPNIGLIDFKRGLGFSESLKVRMRKIYD